MKELPWDNPEELSKLYFSFRSPVALTNYLLGKGFNVSRRTISRRLDEFGIRNNRNDSNYRVLERYNSEQPDHTTFFNLHGDYMIGSDFHIPFFNLDFFDHFCDMASKNKINQCIIIGDFFDAKTISSFSCSDREHSLMTELNVGRELINELFSYFEKIYIIEGNHDARISKFFEYEITLDYIFKSCCTDIRKPQVYFSDYHYCILNDNWRLTHPGNYSKIPGSIPREIAETKHQNVIAGHTHMVSYCWDKSGNYQCIECGGLFDTSKTDYKMKVDKRFPEWQNGFCMMKDNKIKLFDKTSF